MLPVALPGFFWMLSIVTVVHSISWIKAAAVSIKGGPTLIAALMSSELALFRFVQPR